MVFGRYLLGRDGTGLPAAILERYARACGLLFADVTDRRDLAVVLFARRHPWSLPFLDGASALLRPESLLRGKLILMLALLETSPDHAGAFLPAPRSWAACVTRVAARGALGALRAALGLLLLPLAGMDR
jgi:hypothetical protein